jgi:hypothetical protein
MTTTRIVLYPKDIITITGKSGRTARRMILDIRKKYHKEGKLVTVEDFCRYTGLKEEKVRELLKQ